LAPVTCLNSLANFFLGPCWRSILRVLSDLEVLGPSSFNPGDLVVGHAADLFLKSAIGFYAARCAGVSQADTDMACGVGHEGLEAALRRRAHHPDQGGKVGLNPTLHL